MRHFGAPENIIANSLVIQFRRAERVSKALLKPGLAIIGADYWFALDTLETV